jgi:hypothetical protein
LGLAGNAAVESGFNPGINEIAPVVPGSRGGFGLFQWTGPRRKQFEQFAAARNAPLDDLNTQLDFTVWELNNTERRAGEALQGVQDPTEAARIVSERFLRPGTPHLDRRVQETQRLAGRDVSGGNQMQHGLLSTRGNVQGTPFNPQQGQQQAQEPSGILGALSNPDFLDRLAIAFEGLTLNPNQGVIASSSAALQDRAEGRKEQASQQKAEQRMQSSIEFLRSQGRDDLAQALESGVITPADAGRIALTPAERQGRLVTGEQLNQMLPGAQAEPGDIFNLKPDGTASKVGGGGVNVSVNSGTPGLGKLSTDFGFVLNPETGQPVIDPETGLPRAAPVPGSPAALEAERGVEQEIGREAQTRRAGTTVIQDLQRASDLLDDLGPLAANEGVLGGVIRTGSAKVPGTVANRITQFTESALSNVGLDTLQQMRENSPTGGALGQVPIQQQKRLEQVLGSLDIAQPPSVLDANIKRVMNIYTDIIHGSSTERAKAIEDGKLSRDENARIETLYFDLPFDERGRPVQSGDGEGRNRLRFNPETGQLEPVR